MRLRRGIIISQIQESSMYAVVSSGGKQYRVEAGSELVVERLTADAGATITFNRVLLVGDGEAVTVGTPTVQGASVSGTVLGEVLGPKLIVFKFKQKATYRRKRGHRQHLTRVRIDEISAGGRRDKAKADEAEPGPKAEKKPAASTAGAKVEKKPAARKASKADAKPEKKPAARKASKADAKPESTSKSTTRRRTTKAKAEE
jgi:large subunit ribosomal protein L21